MSNKGASGKSNRKRAPDSLNIANVPATSTGLSQPQSHRKASNLNQFKLMANLGDGAYSKVFKVKRIADGQ